MSTASTFPGGAYLSHRNALDYFFGAAPTVVGRVAIRDPDDATQMVDTGLWSADLANTNRGLAAHALVSGINAAGASVRVGAGPLGVTPVSGQIGIKTISTLWSSVDATGTEGYSWINWQAIGEELGASARMLASHSLVSGFDATQGRRVHAGTTGATAVPTTARYGLLNLTETAFPELVLTKSTWVWANSAAANTEVNSDITMVGRRAKWVWLNIWNPSTVSALTVKVQNTFTDNGATTRYGLIVSFGVATNSAVSKLIQYPGGPSATAAGTAFTPAFRLTASNDTVLGAGDGFTASFNITLQDPAS